MQGTEQAPGISKRSLTDIFSQKVKREAGGLQLVTVNVSMIEIYNEAYRDLLEDHNNGSKIEIRENSSGAVSIHGANHVLVDSPAAVDAVAKRGLSNRAVASTKSNQQSSRSHMVLMVDVEVRERDSDRLVSTGRLSMVDLAGSERISKSEATGSALTEAKYINKSLSALIDVMAALSERDKKEKAAIAKQTKAGDGEATAAVSISHIPFRNSKLTHLLSGSLKPGSKLVFITQVAPEADHVNETCNTLDFGTRAKGLDLGKSKLAAVKSVALENAERQIESMTREISKAHAANTTLQQENKNLNIQVEAAAAASAELEKKVDTCHAELTDTLVRNGQLEQKMSDMEQKLASLVNLNHSLSEKNNKLKERESNLNTQIKELQKERDESIRAAASAAAAAARISTLKRRFPEAEVEEEAVESNTRSSPRACITAHANESKLKSKPLEDRDMNVPVAPTPSMRKKVCFDTSDHMSTAEFENTPPLDDGAAARKTRAEELVRWKQMKASSSSILDVPDILSNISQVRSSNSSILASGSARRLGHESMPSGKILGGATALSRSKSASRGLMGMGLPSRVVESSTGVQHGGLSSSAGRKLSVVPHRK